MLTVTLKIISKQFEKRILIFLHCRENGRGGTCAGDSGAPFMIENASDGKYYLFGVVSFGLALTICGESASYSVFSYLNPENMQWINDQLKS